jgi:hypothetical protein
MTISGRAFLDIEGMLQREIEERRKSELKTNKARRKQQGGGGAGHALGGGGAGDPKETHVLDEALLVEAGACILALTRRKLEAQAHVTEAEDWQALLLQVPTLQNSLGAQISEFLMMF